MKKRTLIILTGLTIVLTGVLSFYQVKPRGISEADLARSQDFQNTMTILETITKTTHPSGSAANYAVRDYLVQEINALGLRAEVLPFEVNLADRVNKIATRMAEDEAYAVYMKRFMKAKGYDDPYNYVHGKFGNITTDTALLHNILVKVDVPDTDEGIMLVSHYDSVPTGPGAGDDGIAAASMLSYLQQAVNDDELKNDIYFLFTDGEEQGLLGAYDYVESSPEIEKAKIKSVFNFEARGNQGGLFMFESSKDNYDLVRHLNKAVPQPIAFSIATAIYERMPNDTDFSVFKRAKYDGLNFAMVEGFENYHASTDTVDNLNKDTAYQYMQTVAGIGNYFGKLDLSTLHHTQKAMFFPFLGWTTIVLPEFVGYILGVMPLLIVALVFARNQRKKDIGRLGLGVRIVASLFSVWLTAFSLPASYIVTIPCLLFFLIDLIKASVDDEAKLQLYGSIAFLFATAILIVLTVPLMYMIQVALQNWLITFTCVMLPVAVIIAYFLKVQAFYEREITIPNLA